MAARITAARPTHAMRTVSVPSRRCATGAWIPAAAVQATVQARVRVTAPEIVPEIAQATVPATVRVTGQAIAPEIAAEREVRVPAHAT